MKKNTTKICLLICYLIIILTPLSLQGEATSDISPYHSLTIKFTESDRLHFTLINKTFQKGYVSIGIGAETMENQDYHTFVWIGNEFSATDQWSDDYDTPRSDSSQDILNLTHESYPNGGRIVTYERLLDTKDRNDNVYLNGKNFIAIAWVEDQALTKHGSQILMGTIDLNFSTKEVKFRFKRYVPWELHGLILLFGWTILNTTGYVFGRLFRHLTYFKWIHIFTSGFNAFLTIAFFIVGITKSVEFPEGNGESISKLHLAYGIIIMVITCLLIINGNFIAWFIYGSKIETQSNLFPKLLHKILGIFLSWTVPISIITGGYLLYQE